MTNEINCLGKMLTKARTKLVKSLKLKKNRKQKQLFVVEGAKNVLELLDSDFLIHSLYATEDFITTHAKVLNLHDIEILRSSESELTEMSTFKSNEQALSVVKIKENESLNALNKEFAVMLENVQDPGNLGTILRVCDWYGIKKVIASEDCVDIYNPKVISASMGSFTRVQIFYTSLRKFIERNPAPYFGAFMNGSSVHEFEFGSWGYIILGNESNGISNELDEFIDQRISIPSYGTAESLNVGIATAVILDNLRR